MRHSIVAALAFSFTATSALASGVVVPIDEARTVTFVRNVSIVYIGNSAIAEVTMVDARHGVVLGKAYGTTNVIALDTTGHEVSNVPVSVAETRGATVTLFKGVGQMTMSCGGPRCEVAPTPGDFKYKEDLLDVSQHHDLGVKSASVSP